MAFIMNFIMFLNMLLGVNQNGGTYNMNYQQYNATTMSVEYQMVNLYAPGAVTTQVGLPGQQTAIVIVDTNEL
jgi:hypothetical protein